MLVVGRGNVREEVAHARRVKSCFFTRRKISDYFTSFNSFNSVPSVLTTFFGVYIGLFRSHLQYCSIQDVYNASLT